MILLGTDAVESPQRCGRWGVSNTTRPSSLGLLVWSKPCVRVHLPRLDAESRPVAWATSRGGSAPPRNSWLVAVLSDPGIVCLAVAHSGQNKTTYLGGSRNWSKVRTRLCRARLPFQAVPCEWSWPAKPPRQPCFCKNLAAPNSDHTPSEKKATKEAADFDTALHLFLVFCRGRASEATGAMALLQAGRRVAAGYAA
jgi:hypothetical protein